MYTFSIVYIFITPTPFPLMKSRHHFPKYSFKKTFPIFLENSQTATSHEDPPSSLRIVLTWAERLPWHLADQWTRRTWKHCALYEVLIATEWLGGTVTKNIPQNLGSLLFLFGDYDYSDTIYPVIIGIKIRHFLNMEFIKKFQRYYTVSS